MVQATEVRNEMTKSNTASLRLASLVAAVMALLISPVQAQTVEELLQEMAAIEQNAETRQAAVQDGEERAQLCFRCHGQDGNSKRDYIPNLASQNAAYLFTQFEKFANGQRQDYVMSTLAKHLSADDRIDIALYFADREVSERQQPVATSAAGERIYNSVCFACHGKEGHGSATYPRIAGQPYEFLETTLLKFLHNDPDRRNSPMVAVMKNLNEQQIKDVAAYVAHMP